MSNHTEHTIFIRSITEYEVPSYHPDYNQRSKQPHLLEPIHYNKNLSELISMLQVIVGFAFIISTITLLAGAPALIFETIGTESFRQTIDIFTFGIALFAISAGLVQPLIFAYRYYDQANTHNHHTEYEISDIADAMASLRQVYFDRDNTVYFGYMFIDVEASTQSRLILKMPDFIKPSSISNTPTQDAIIENLDASNQYPTVQFIIDKVFDVYYLKEREYNQTLAHGNIKIHDDTSTPFYLVMQHYANEQLLDSQQKAGDSHYVKETHDSTI